MCVQVVVVVVQFSTFAGVPNAQLKVACVGDCITAPPTGWCKLQDIALGPAGQQVEDVAQVGRWLDAIGWAAGDQGGGDSVPPDAIIAAFATRRDLVRSLRRALARLAAAGG